MLSSLLAPLFLVACALAAPSPHEQLVQLAAAGNGVIQLTADTFDLLTSPKRAWSVSVQLTALDNRRRCGPCKYDIGVLIYEASGSFISF